MPERTEKEASGAGQADQERDARLGPRARREQPHAAEPGADDGGLAPAGQAEELHRDHGDGEPGGGARREHRRRLARGPRPQVPAHAPQRLGDPRINHTARLSAPPRLVV